MLDFLIPSLAQGASLSPAQVLDAVNALVDESISPETKATFLTALARKGETPEEIAQFANELRQRARAFPALADSSPYELLDVCGTGGDHANTFNISTTVALIAASAGVRVVKHGNRAITSQSGSADVLEALGIPIDLPPDQASEMLQKHGFVFLFAPLYHPAFKHIAPARKLCAERGQRTLFNFLGPLLNPARPSAQLLGVSRPELCAPMARTLQSLGLRRAMVVCGSLPSSPPSPAAPSAPTRPTPAYLDEFSTLGPTHIAEFHHDRGFSETTWSPEMLPIQPAHLSDLAGGAKELNAQIILDLLQGKIRGPKRDAAQLNAAAALFVAGRTRSFIEGWDLVDELLNSGAAFAKWEQLTRIRS